MIPESEWTKGQREFVGSTFPTPKGGVLTVTGVAGKKNGVVLFFTSCSICSEDIELWDTCHLTTSKGSLVRGQIPCGCSSSIRWTEKQYGILIKRMCKGRDLVFHGYVRGNSSERVTQRTCLILEDKQSGRVWDTTNLSNVLTGMCNPKEKRVNRYKQALKREKDCITRFTSSGYFLEGTKFSKVQGEPVWNYTCPKCSYDEYVTAGVCSGIFKTTGSDLNSGKRSCRCSKVYYWNTEQREYQINRICKEEGLSFLGWEDEEGYKRPTSKFKWRCKRGCLCSSTVDDFINAGCRCFSCRKKCGSNGNGFYRHRVKEKDTLYILRFKEGPYIKVGRTFNFYKRLPQIAKESKNSLESIEVLATYTSNHETVYKIEQQIHNILDSEGYYHTESDWSTETFNLDCQERLSGLLKLSGLKREA